MDIENYIKYYKAAISEAIHNLPPNYIIALINKKKLHLLWQRTKTQQLKNQSNNTQNKN